MGKVEALELVLESSLYNMLEFSGKQVIVGRVPWRYKVRKILR